jgi:hypothetical protein
VVLAVGARFKGQACPARHRHQRDADAAYRRQDGRELVAFAAVADGQHHIAGRHHAQVAMAGFTGVDKKRRRAGRSQGGGDLAPDVATLAHAHHHHTALAGQAGTHGLNEALALARGQAQQGTGFNLEGLPRHRQRARAVHARGLPGGVRGALQ